MTPNVHDPAARPRWLLPALLTLTITVALVAAGFVSLSTVLYVGLFGGMILMHLGGHGAHGGHGGRGGHGRADGHAGHAAHAANGGQTRRAGHADHAGHAGSAGLAAGDLRIPSSGAQAGRPSSGYELDHGARADASRNETNDHDKGSSHGCH
jgi:hypothetical protein